MKECILLAGGLGTRLQSVIKDIPKCMAEVAGKPFLSYLFDYLLKEKFEHIILALGYKSDVVIEWIATQNYPFEISIVIENEPLGTGGAIKLAMGKIKSDRAFIMNGDTFFDIDSDKLLHEHLESNAAISVSLKYMTEFDRYGSVKLNKDKRIVEFNEKQYCKEGLINGGIYLINSDIFDRINTLPDKFSFEKDVMEKWVKEVKIQGCLQDKYFIDIGIPSDFEKANIDFRNK